ncbi:MAG: carbohydrate kinase [Myxococcales bacterium]|nr:carbohydrate kinase [Myxococcales bacterium]
MTPTLLVLGHVTLDRVQGQGLGAPERLGGAASFCARVAARLGETVGVVTRAPPAWPLLEELSTEPGVHVHPVAGACVTTFVLRYQDGHRDLLMPVRADPLLPDDVPSAWRSCPTAFLGPVADETPRELVGALEASFVGIGLQGVMRTVGRGAQVSPRWPADWLATWPPSIKVASFSEDDHPDAPALAAALAARGVLAALTQGRRGATLFLPRAGGVVTTLSVPVLPVPEEDPTGAGDSFAVTLTLGLARGQTPQQAAGEAARVAALVVGGPGLGRLPPRDGLRDAK